MVDRGNRGGRRGRGRGRLIRNFSDRNISQNVNSVAESIQSCDEIVRDKAPANVGLQQDLTGSASEKSDNALQHTSQEVQDSARKNISMDVEKVKRFETIDVASNGYSNNIECDSGTEVDIDSSPEDPSTVEKSQHMDNENKLQNISPENFDESVDNQDNPDIEFTIGDNELAEFDTEETEESKFINNNNSRVPVSIQQSEEKCATPASAAITVMNKEQCPNTEAATKSATDETANPIKLGTQEKKMKRKFGLEYIVVSVAQPVSGDAAPSMRNSPHECALCLPGQSFNAIMMAKHMHSAQHIKAVMELHSTALYNEHVETDDPNELHRILSESLPEPLRPVKLLVVTELKLNETREKILQTIKQKKESMAAALPMVKEDLRSKLESLRQAKRVCSDAGSSDESGNAAKRTRIAFAETEQFQTPESSSDDNKPVLLVGDDRAKQMYDADPDLASICTLAWYPGGRLQKILAGAMMRLNSSYKVIIIVSFMNEFVVERMEKTKKLMMMNPDVEEIGQLVAKFASKIRNINSSIKLVFTIPTYVDFIQYNKPIRHLSPSDFARLEDFSCQVMDAFKRLHGGIRFMANNTFSFNMNITIKDKGNSHDTQSHRNTAAAMQFLPGMLADGFHMSDRAMKMVASEMHRRVCGMVAKITNYTPTSNSSLIECWADCEDIIVIGDHHTFKFETSAPLDMIKNVTLVSEKFAPMSKLLETADRRLTPSVDILIIVGFYREFAQNVISHEHTLLEPKVPNKQELFSILHMFKKKWTKKFPRLTVLFTIPQVVDFSKYNSANNPGITKRQGFLDEMNIFSHQFSINIMSFYKELRPSLTMGSRRVWLYHITNSLYENNEHLLSTLGNFSVRAKFPPNSTFDGFKPNQDTALRIRSDLVTYITKLLRKNPVQKYKK